MKYKKVKNLIVVALTLCMLLFAGICIVNIFNEKPLTNNNIEGASSFSGGNGSSWYPYQISSAADLNTLAYDVNNGTTYKDIYFELTTDIDMSSITDWRPIGYKDAFSNHSFQGSLDGCGYSIKNLKFKEHGGYVYGLFGTVGAKGEISIDNEGYTALIRPAIKNLKLENFEMEIKAEYGQMYDGGFSVGALAANVYGDYEISNIQVKNFSVVASGDDPYTFPLLRIGGLIGESHDEANVSDVYIHDCEVMSFNVNVDAIIRGNSVTSYPFTISGIGPSLNNANQSVTIERCVFNSAKSFVSYSGSSSLSSDTPSWQYNKLSAGGVSVNSEYFTSSAGCGSLQEGYFSKVYNNGHRWWFYDSTYNSGYLTLMRFIEGSNTFKFKSADEDTGTLKVGTKDDVNDDWSTTTTDQTTAATIYSLKMPTSIILSEGAFEDYSNCKILGDHRIIPEPKEGYKFKEWKYESDTYVAYFEEDGADDGGGGGDDSGGNEDPDPTPSPGMEDLYGIYCSLPEEGCTNINSAFYFYDNPNSNIGLNVNSNTKIYIYVSQAIYKNGVSDKFKNSDFSFVYSAKEGCFFKGYEFNGKEYKIGEYPKGFSGINAKVKDVLQEGVVAYFEPIIETKKTITFNPAQDLNSNELTTDFVEFTAEPATIEVDVNTTILLTIDGTTFTYSNKSTGDEYATYTIKKKYYRLLQASKDLNVLSPEATTMEIQVKEDLNIIPIVDFYACKVSLGGIDEEFGSRTIVCDEFEEKDSSLEFIVMFGTTATFSIGLTGNQLQYTYTFTYNESTVAEITFTMIDNLHSMQYSFKDTGERDHILNGIIDEDGNEGVSEYEFNAPETGNLPTINETYKEISPSFGLKQYWGDLA